MDVLVPKSEVNTEMLEILAADGYARIFPTIDPLEDEAGLICFSKLATPSTMDALRHYCQAGDQVVLTHLDSSLVSEAEQVLREFSYTMAIETRARIDKEQELFPYYRRQFDEQRVEARLHYGYERRSRRGKIEAPNISYDVRYQSFVVSEHKNLQDPVLLRAGMQEQKLGITLAVDMFGSSNDPSILMRFSNFCVGVFRHGFLGLNPKQDNFLGFFPETITVTLKPASEVGIVPCYIDRDEGLSMVADYHIAKSRSEEYKGEVVVKLPGALKLGLAATSKANDNSGIRSTLVTPANFGDGTAACLQWRIVTWADKRPFHTDKPHMAITMLGELPVLPFVGTGPVISGMDRIRWSAPNAKVFEQGSKFNLTIETMMVLLHKDMAVTFCGLGSKVLGRTTRVKVVHTAEMELIKA